MKTMNSPRPFSAKLQAKLQQFEQYKTPTKLGTIDFSSKLLLAPMAGICNIPFRLLMEDLGAGGTVSELISCHGINYKGQKTLDMLKIHPLEKNIGLQLFGEDAHKMASAAQIAEEYGPKFIDINMGCPVKKVVTKGGGSALLRDVKSLGPFFSTIKKAIKVPLTIKIRMGWDSEEINADEIIKVAADNGIEWVAIHGRTRAQQYTGLANWDYIESISQNSPLPIIGNGDLHQPHQVSKRLQNSNTQALMIARGCLRNPFIFLESLDPEYAQKNNSLFYGEDYWEVVERLYQYCVDTFEQERAVLVQMRKLITWFAAGFPGAAAFRGEVFTTQDLQETLKLTQRFFYHLESQPKRINYDEIFMSSGHG
jgi:nifR3 family TIM-barrel protein